MTEANEVWIWTGTESDKKALKRCMVALYEGEGNEDMLDSDIEEWEACLDMLEIQEKRDGELQDADLYDEISDILEEMRAEAREARTDN